MKPGTNGRASLERAQLDPGALSQISAMETRTPVRLALDLAVEHGQLAADIDLDVATSVLLGPLLYRSLMTSRDVDEEFADTIVDAFLQVHRDRVRRCTTTRGSA